MRSIIILTLTLVITLLVSTRDSRVDAGLIHIYHRYKPKATEETLNSSSSSPPLVEHLEDPDQHVLEGSEIEFSSPMKRIMELISHHPPVIVVSSDAPAPQTQEPIKGGGENSMVNIVQAPMTPQSQMNPMNYVNAPNAISDRQQWTLISPSQMIQQNSQPQQQQQPQQQPSTILTGQQQQLIQTAVPFEQYYLSPGQMGDGNQQQYAVMPANMGFSSANSYQQLSTMPYGQPMGQVASLQPQQPVASVDERTQPIFLSSYVPEVPLQVNKQITPYQSAQSTPNSIQQIQNSQAPVKKSEPTPEPKPATKKEPEEKGNEGQTSNGKSEDDEPPDETGPEPHYDPEEDVHNNQDSPSRHSDEPNDDIDESPNSSGSSSYHDKYDSDKDEPRSKRSESPKTDRKEEPRSSSSKNHKFKAEPLAASGLAGTGLDDNCLQCICRASSGCDQNLGCITAGAEEKYCGPFQITEEYWQKAGSPGDSSKDFSSYEECANDTDCAVETVTNYMKKYHKDCDDDGLITCLDYARLHRLGPSGCGNLEKLSKSRDYYWPKFQRCAEGYNRTNNPDDEDI